MSLIAQTVRRKIAQTVKIKVTGHLRFKGLIGDEAPLELETEKATLRDALKVLCNQYGERFESVLFEPFTEEIKRSNLVLLNGQPYINLGKWLETELKKSNADWKFAIFHFPPYSYEEDYPTIRKHWGALFDEYHVDMVMSGHVHYYMRSKPMNAGKPVASPENGTIYLISISIPHRTREMPSREWVDVRFGGEGLYQTFDIDNKKLVYRSLNIEGEVKDELIIQK